MTIQTPLTGNAPGLSKANFEVAKANPPAIHPTWAPLVGDILKQVSIDLIEVKDLLTLLIEKNGQEANPMTSGLRLAQRLIENVMADVDGLAEDLPIATSAPKEALKPVASSGSPDLAEIHAQAVHLQGIFEAMTALRDTLGPKGLAMDSLIECGLPRARQLSRALDGATEMQQG